MMPRSPASPEPICPRCSKPITPGTAAQYGRHSLHIRCLSRASQIEASEQQDRASRARNRAEALIEETSDLAAQARARPWLCPVCQQRLRAGGGLLFQGDVLVHATCWRDPPHPPTPS